MKPVIYTTTTKSGDKETVLNPTPRMLLYAITWAKDLTRVEDEVCDAIGIHRRSIKRWKELYDQPKQQRNYFSEWLEDTVESLANTDEQKKSILEAVGMIEATQGGYQFWRDMSRTYGAIKEEVKSTSITINTDFSQIAIGANFDEARRALLKSTQGVELPRTAPVAPIIEHQQPQGVGGGTGGVQEEPVAVLDPLATNGRYAKRGRAVPIIPSKKTPSDSH